MRFIPILFLILLFSCKSRNQLNNKEQELIQQITNEEKLKSENQQNVKKQQMAITPGIRLIEDRNIDVQNPPIPIKLAEQRNDSMVANLSDLTSEVEIIKLDPLPDTSNYMAHTLNVKLTPKHIIVYGMSGVFLYNREGRFLKTIVGNKLKGFNIKVWKDGMSSRMSYQSANVYYRGSLGEVFHMNECLYFTCYDSDKGELSYRKLDLSDSSTTLMLSQNAEKDLSAFPGEEIRKLTKTESDGFVRRLNKVAVTIPLSETIFANIPSAWSNVSKGSNVVIGSESAVNDTLCEHKNPTRLENFTHSVNKRGSTKIRRYWYKNALHMYSVFSDTVFRVESPSRFVPAYVFDFGGYGFSPSEYFAPKKLCGFIGISDMLVETSGSVYIEYYDVDGSVGFGIYNKATKRFKSIANGKKNRGVVDDVFGHYAYWPRSVNANYEEGKLFTGAFYKELVKSDGFKNSRAARKSEIEQIAQTTHNKHLYLTIYRLK